MKTRWNPVDLRLAGGQSIWRPSIVPFLRQARDVRHAHLDLADADFVNPDGLVAIAVVAEHAAASGRTVTFASPSNADVRTYLARMNLAMVLDRLDITHDLPEVRHHPTDNLTELKRFEGRDGADDLAQRVLDSLFDVSPHARPLYRAVHEIAQNVLDHSDRDCGYLAMQRYQSKQRSGVGERIVFAIGDSGIGLRRSLRRAHDVRDDLDAVRLAATKGVTSTTNSSRGHGINSVVRSAADLDGRVQVYSGSAATQVRLGTSVSRPVHISQIDRKAMLTLSVPGTMFVVSLRLS